MDVTKLFFSAVYLTVLLFVLLLSTSPIADHKIGHDTYAHDSTASTLPSPIMAGFQEERRQVVETTMTAPRSFAGGGEACIGCESVFLGINNIQYDFTLLSPLRDLFLHINANERFKNKLIRTKFGQANAFFFEYTSQNEVTIISGLPPADVVALSENPTDFYKKYGNQYISQRVLGEYFLVSYHIEFASDEERLFFEENVKLPKPMVTNFNPVFSSEIVDVLQRSHLDGAVTIGVHQVGGDSAHLSNFVESHLGYAAPKSMSCAFSDLSPCFDLYSRWYNYIFDDAGMSSSIDNVSIDTPILTHVLAYIVKPYSFMGLQVSTPINSSVLPAWRELVEFQSIANQLAAYYNEAQQNYERVSVLLSLYRGRMNDEEYNYLIGVESDLLENINTIANIGLACVDFESSCMTDFSNLSLHVIDDTSLHLSPLSEEEQQERLKLELEAPSRNNSGSGGAGLFFLIPLLLVTIRCAVRRLVY